MLWLRIRYFQGRGNHAQEDTESHTAGHAPAAVRSAGPGRRQRHAQQPLHPGLEGILQLPRPPHRQQLQDRGGPEERQPGRHLLDGGRARGHRLLGVDRAPRRVPLHLLRREQAAHQHQRPLSGGGPRVPDGARRGLWDHAGSGEGLRGRQLPAHGVARLRRRQRAGEHPSVGDGPRQVRHHAGVRPLRRRAGHDGRHHPHLCGGTGHAGPGGVLLRAGAVSARGGPQRPLVQRHADPPRVLRHREREPAPVRREDHPGDPALQARGGHHPRHHGRVRPVRVQEPPVHRPRPGEQELPGGGGGRVGPQEIPQIRGGVRHLAGEEAVHPLVRQEPGGDGFRYTPELLQRQDRLRDRSGSLRLP